MEKIKRHITELTDIPPSPETVFDPKNPPHLRQRFIERWIEDPEKIHPDQRKAIEVHIGICDKCHDRATAYETKTRGSLPFDR